eukprot:1111306-Rhodomonas_salina.1
MEEAEFLDLVDKSSSLKSSFVFQFYGTSTILPATKAMWAGKALFANTIVLGWCPGTIESFTPHPLVTSPKCTLSILPSRKVSEVAPNVSTKAYKIYPSPEMSADAEDVTETGCSQTTHYQ